MQMHFEYSHLKAVSNLTRHPTSRLMGAKGFTHFDRLHQEEQTIDKIWITDVCRVRSLISGESWSTHTGVILNTLTTQLRDLASCQTITAKHLMQWSCERNWETYTVLRISFSSCTSPSAHHDTFKSCSADERAPQRRGKSKLKGEREITAKTYCLLRSS